MTRIIVGPICHGELIDLKRADGLTFRKQILPATPIVYRGRRIKNDEQYRRDLAQAFNDKAMGEAVHFLIEDANGHNAGPEQIRAEVVGMDAAQPGENPGLYATIAFPDEAAAVAVRNSGNKLGVSPRIFEGLTRGDGKFIKAAVGSVLGTLTPVNVGMSPWQPVDLSAYTDAEVWDFSATEPEESEMARGRTRRTTDLSSGGTDTLERDQLEELTDEQLEDLVADAVAELGDDEDEDPDEDEVVETPAGRDDPDEDEVADLSQLDLAQEARIAALEQQTNDALGQLAQSNWDRERRVDFAQVPTAILDLCNTVMTQPEARVIDLANGDEFDPAQFVRQVLAMVNGYELIDLGHELGHTGDPDEVNDAAAADDKVIDQLEAKYGY